MNDRELLEMAAKAAGIELVGWLNEVDATAKTASGVWEPLYDDGDAFRLAVRLEIEIEHAELAVIATHRAYNWGWLGEGVNEDYGDRYAATRRVIVRAAAEIGRNMK